MIVDKCLILDQGTLSENQMQCTRTVTIRRQQVEFKIKKYVIIVCRKCTISSRTFQSVCLPHGQWPAPMGSWRVKYMQQV